MLQMHARMSAHWYVELAELHLEDGDVMGQLLDEGLRLLRLLLPLPELQVQQSLHHSVDQHSSGLVTNVRPRGSHPANGRRPVESRFTGFYSRILINVVDSPFYYLL